MKKITLLLAMMFGLVAGPALASYGVTVNGKTTTYAKKDKEYWTAVWYAKRGLTYRGGAAASKRSVKKKSVVKRRKVVRKASYRKRNSGKVSVFKRKRNIGGKGVVARVNLSSQTMNVYKNGVHQYTWKVSSGRKGYSTPTGSWRIGRMHKEYYSRKYDNAPMPYAMFYYRGFAVHGTNSISRLGRPASHGCIRLHPQNAATLFSMVRRYGGRVKVTY